VVRLECREDVTREAGTVLGAVELPLGEHQLPLFDPDGTDTRPLVLGGRLVETPTRPVVRLAPARHGTESPVTVRHIPRESRRRPEFEPLPLVVGRRVEVTDRSSDSFLITKNC
jgi:hypothetical protein